jgi:hypothetical protein
MERQTMRKTTRWLLAMFLVGICGRGYGIYNQTLNNAPQVWTDIVRGTASAPEQYRVGVVVSAYWIAQHVGWHGHMLRMSVVFWIFDVAGACLAALLLYQLLLKTAVFQRASATMQWFGSAAFVALTFYLMDWVIWYQRVSTLPTAGIVAAMVWLWTPGEGAANRARQAGMVAAFFLLTAAQSLIRADVAVMVCAGVFVASATRISPKLSLPRPVAMTTALVAGLMAAAVQVYLVKVRYPQATYGDVPVVMLVHEWFRPVNMVTALIFLAPFLWTLREALRRRYFGEGAGGAFLIAGVGYACLWLVFGRMDEVRIFLPMALAVTPVTVEMAMLRVAEAGRSGDLQVS